MNKTKELSALDRYKIIHPFLDGQTTLSNLAKEQPIQLRTLRRWVHQYRKNGIKGLERKQRVDKGTRHNLNEEQQQVIEALILKKPPLSIAAIQG